MSASESVELNAIVEGTVVKIKPFGAIVELPDKSQGLVHISHISNKYVQNIEDFVAIGDTVNVKVISIEPESGKISLSIKETEVVQPRQNSRNHHSFENASFGRSSVDSSSSFEDKFKDWLKDSNERHAGLNKRNKRR